MFLKREKTTNMLSKLIIMVDNDNKRTFQNPTLMIIFHLVIVLELEVLLSDSELPPDAASLAEFENLSERVVAPEVGMAGPRAAPSVFVDKDPVLAVDDEPDLLLEEVDFELDLLLEEPDFL